MCCSLVLWCAVDVGLRHLLHKGLIPSATKRLLTVIKGIFNCCHLTRPGSNDTWETVHWFLEDDDLHIWLMLHSNNCFVQLSLDKKIRETSDLLTQNQKLESRLAGADEDYRRYTIPPWHLLRCQAPVGMPCISLILEMHFYWCFVWRLFPFLGLMFELCLAVYLDFLLTMSCFCMKNILKLLLSGLTSLLSLLCEV